MPNVKPKSHSLPARSSPGSRLGGNARFASALAALLLAPGLSGCILGSERPALGLEIPSAYRGAASHAPNAAAPAMDWWRGFRSPELTSLMEQSQIFNLDIAAAVAQIVQADALVGVSGAPLLPSVTGTATAEREHFGSQSGASSGLGTGSGVASGGGSSTFNQFNMG